MPAPVSEIGSEAVGTLRGSGCAPARAGSAARQRSSALRRFPIFAGRLARRLPRRLSALLKALSIVEGRGTRNGTASGTPPTRCAGKSGATLVAFRLRPRAAPQARTVAHPLPLTSHVIATIAARMLCPPRAVRSPPTVEQGERSAGSDVFRPQPVAVDPTRTRARPIRDPKTARLRCACDRAQLRRGLAVARMDAWRA